MVKAKVTKWGNAAGIRLPKDFCDQLGIAIGDEVSIELDGDRITVEPAPGRWTLEGRLAHDWDGTRHQSPHIDWGPAVGKERWWEEEDQ